MTDDFTDLGWLLLGVIGLNAVAAIYYPAWNWCFG